MKPMNNEKLEEVYNGLCGVRNVLDWKPEISMEERIAAAEKAFNEASEALFQADKELAPKGPQPDPPCEFCGGDGKYLEGEHWKVCPKGCKPEGGPE